MRTLRIAFVFAAFLVVSYALAATQNIDFESSSLPGAVPGAEATNLYTSLGVRFPSRPTIERDEFLSTQVLQQAGPRGRGCAALEMEFSAAMGVRDVRMRVINRHLRRYSVQAFNGTTEVDSFVFRVSRAGGPPFPPPLHYTDITLRASVGEPDITRIVARPPAGCFDLMIIDNLVIESLHDPVPIDPVRVPGARVVLAAYEVSQGVMGRVTQPHGPGLSRPDTGLMALPEKKLPILSGRNTGIRFYFHATRAYVFLDTILSVEIFYRDGTSRRKVLIGENTVGGGTLIAPRLFGTTDEVVRRSVVLRRAVVDDSLDFVIPGPVLVNASRALLALSEEREGVATERLATIEIPFEVSHTIGVNFVRIHGIGAASGAGAPPPAEPARSFMEGYLEDIYPVRDIRTRRFPIPFGVDTGFDNCATFLTAIAAAFEDLTTESEREFSTAYWTNVYFLGATPSDCAALGFYHTSHAFVANVFDAPHEIGHTIGLNHVTNLHGENGGYEDWPYLHGNIGTVDEGLGYNDGVFGLIMDLAPGSEGADLITDWGTWNMGPIPPCRGSLADLFPACTAGDTNTMHDFMSYGAGDNLPKWGGIVSSRWTSDINYHRIARFLEECTVLDPVNRFWGPAPADTAITSSNPRCRAGGGAGGQPGGEGGMRSEALILSGIITPEGLIESFHVLRKPVLSSVFSNVPGDLLLTMYDPNGLVLQQIPFRARVSPPEQESPEGRTFVVVAPWEPQLTTFTITSGQEPITLERTASANAPSIKLLAPKPGDVWETDQGNGPFIRWSAIDFDQETLRVYIQYSPDKGATWQPVASLDAAREEFLVDVKDLDKTEEALIYISVTDGLHSDAVLMPGAFAVRTSQ
ncbi:MAG: hypothetical protein O7H41_01705 [Planctomycetota bacterium]|nr:hypothetical protein [Planctomycetota bacterium]